MILKEIRMILPWRFLCYSRQQNSVLFSFLGDICVCVFIEIHVKKLKKQIVGGVFFYSKSTVLAATWSTDAEINFSKM